MQPPCPWGSQPALAARPSLSQGGLPYPVMTFSLDLIPPDGGAAIPFSFSAVPMPEPAGLAVLGLGLAILAYGRTGRSRTVR